MAGRILSILFIALCSTVSVAQVDFSKYFGDNDLPFLNTEDHLDVRFKWNMQGNMQVFVNEGLNYLREGNLPLAISNFDQGITLDSSLWLNYYYRGIAHKKNYHLREAHKDFIKAIQLNPEQAETYLELGELYHSQNELKEAENQYEKSVRVNPALVQGYYNLGNVALAKGDSRKALKYYQKCNAVDPKFPDAYMTQGIIKFKAKNNDPASLVLFDKALEVDSTYTQVYFWRGLAYAGQNQLDNALMDWNKLVRFNPNNTFLYVMRGFLNIELKKFDDAFTDLKKAILARELDDNKFVGAQTRLDKQIDLQAAANYVIRTGYGLNEEAFTFLKTGFCLLLVGREREALENLRKAERIERSAAIHYIKALAFEHLNKHDSAFSSYGRVLRLDNDIFDAHKKRAIYWAELKNYKMAYADHAHMLRLQPQSIMVYRLRGLARSNEHDFKGAIEDLTTFIEKDSSDYEALRTLSVCKDALGDGHGANRALEKMLYIRSNDWMLFHDVGNNYVLLKDTISAIRVFRMYARGNFNDFTPRIILAELYTLTSQFDSARSISTSIEAMESFKLLKTYNKARYEIIQAQLHYLEGLILFKQARYAEAIAHLSESLKENKRKQEARYLRAKAYQITGEKNKSLSDLKELKSERYKDAEVLYNALVMK